MLPLLFSISALCLLWGNSFPVAKAAEQNPADFYASCKTGNHPVESPLSFLRERGLKPENACPTQTRIDAQHECQTAADSLKNIYRGLLELRRDSCVKARDAAAQAEKDCVGQAACLEAQKKALAAYQDAVAKEIEGVRYQQETLNQVASYAVDEIAGGGAKLLGYVMSDQNTPDDGSQLYGPKGRGGSAQWLKASSNKQALEEVFHNENRDRAEAIVDKFKRNFGLESDITGLKSDLIKEPLRIAAASRDWNKEIDQYVHSLEQGKVTMARQAGDVARRERKLKEQNGPTSTISGLPKDSKTEPQASSETGGSAPKEGGLGSLPAMPSLASDGGSITKAAAGGATESAFLPATGGRNLAQILSKAAERESGNPPARELKSGDVKDSIKQAAGPSPGSMSAASSLTGSSQNEAPGNSRKPPALLRKRPGAVGMPGAASNVEQGPGEAAAKLDGTAKNALIESGDPYELQLAGGEARMAVGRNEAAVEKSGSGWSGSLNAERQAGGVLDGPPSSDSSMEAEDSLFARVNGAHLRALRRGLLIPKLRERL